MITYQRELVSDLWDEAWPLLEAHWREIARYHDIPLAPDRALYTQVEDAGALRCYTARQAGGLVGYAVFFVRQAAHYKTSLQAIQDVLYIDKASRGGLKAGVCLIRYAEEQLRTEGVQVVYHHTKRRNRLGQLLQHIGYELADEIYAKRLDQGE